MQQVEIRPGVVALCYSDDLEVIPEGEATDIEAVNESFARIRAFTFEKHRHALRDAHAKSHGILRGELRVHQDLSSEFAQGIFVPGGSYPVIARLSTSPSDISPDGIAALRGMALKVIGVEGEQVLPHLAGSVTQDFLMANHPTISAGDAASFRRQSVLLEQATKQPEKLQRVATAATRAAGNLLRRAGIDVAGTAAGMAKPQSNILGDTYFTQAASRFGDYVAKIRLVPHSENVASLKGQSVSTFNRSILRDLVRDFFASQAAVYGMQVQLGTDLERTPIEDASVEWSEDVAPFEDVATLHFEPQDPYSPARRVYGDDVLSFNPWHSIVEHRPLGSIQRLRRSVYENSATDRHRLNCQPMAEPRSIEELPD